LQEVFHFSGDEVSCNMRAAGLTGRSASHNLGTEDRAKR